MWTLTNNWIWWARLSRGRRDCSSSPGEMQHTLNY